MTTAPDVPPSGDAPSGGLEAERLRDLRAAVWARVAISAGLTVYSQLQVARTSPGIGHLVAALASFALYVLPFGYVLWALRERLDRFAVWLAIAFSLTGIGSTLLTALWYWSVVARSFRSMGPGTGSQGALYLASILLGVGVAVAVVVTAWRARQAMPRRPEGATSALAAVLAVGYTSMAWLFSTVIYRLASWR